MSKLKDVGLIRVLLLVGALVVANGYVVWNSGRLEAQDPTCGTAPQCEFQDSKCTSDTPNSQNFCDYHPSFGCTLSQCTDTALEP